MKKITLFIFVLATSMSFAQTSNYCNTAVTHLNIPAAVNSTINLTIENINSTSIKITAAAADIDFLDIVGTPIAGGAATRTPNDVSVSGEISTVLTYTSTPPTNVVLQFLQWRRTSTGGDTWQLENVTTPFTGDCVIVDPMEDISLSDLQVDGVTINGFGSLTTTYNIGVANATPVPQITSVTTTNPNAVVGAITQATAVPGSATFNVTSEDTNIVETYTINFAIQVPLTELIGNGGFETGDFTDWDLTGEVAQTIITTNPSEGTFAANINNTVSSTGSGIKSSNRGVGLVNPGDQVTIKFDARGSFDIGGVLFAELFSEFSGGGATNELLGGGPIALNSDSEVWTSYEFTTNLGSDVGGGISLLFIAQTGGGTSANVFIDNVSVVDNDQALSTNDLVKTAFRTYPNPTQDNWTIETQNVRMSSITVYDVLGKSVMSMTPNEDRAVIDGSSLKSGLYFAKVETDEGTSSVKLVKN